MALRRYRARWLVPVEGPPIEDGAVLVGTDGRLAAIGPSHQVPCPPAVPDIDLGGVAILPGLVNTHTHLELTGFDGQNQETEFPAWIRQTIALKAARSPGDFLVAARQGIRDCWAAGVTTVADTGDSGTVIQALAEAGGSGIAYHEAFGPDPAQVAAILTGYRQRLEQLREWERPRVRLGLSPHAPYSVSGALYAGVARLAGQLGRPLAVHLAESAAESELLEYAAGGFAEQWRGRGITLPSLPGRTPVDWLHRHGVLTPSTLCIHMVRVSDADLDRVHEQGAAIAHCPRSNESHGHGPAPLAAMLHRGIRIGVGTDSVLSAAPLDLLAEARAARSLGGLTAERALALLTLEGARALGLDREIGSLLVGKWADLTVVALPQAVDAAGLADTLLTRRRADVRLTVLGGREVWRGPAYPT